MQQVGSSSLLFQGRKVFLVIGDGTADWSSSFMARVALKLKNGESYTADSELVLVH